MAINSELNLAFPIRWVEKPKPTTENPDAVESVPLVWAYHTPISRDIFEANYRIIAATQIALSGKGRIGFRIATLALRDAARADAIEYGISAATADALLAEIKRLTTVLTPTDAGYRNVDVDRAIANGVLDKEEWEEVESALVFFTCAYSLVTKSTRTSVIGALASVLRGSITSSKPTEFAAGLAISTTSATTADAEPPPAEPAETPQVPQ